MMRQRASLTSSMPSTGHDDLRRRRLEICKVSSIVRVCENDGRIKALVQALMNAIPRRETRRAISFAGMTTLEAMRLLFWPDLPAPKEEEVPKCRRRRRRYRGKDDDMTEIDTDDEEEDEE